MRKGAFLCVLVSYFGHMDGCTYAATLVAGFASIHSVGVACKGRFFWRWLGCQEDNERKLIMIWTSSSEKLCTSGSLCRE